MKRRAGCLRVGFHWTAKEEGSLAARLRNSRERRVRGGRLPSAISLCVYCHLARARGASVQHRAWSTVERLARESHGGHHASLPRTISISFTSAPGRGAKTSAPAPSESMSIVSRDVVKFGSCAARPVSSSTSARWSADLANLLEVVFEGVCDCAHPERAELVLERLLALWGEERRESARDGRRTARGRFLGRCWLVRFWSVRSSV